MKAVTVVSVLLLIVGCEANGQGRDRYSLPPSENTPTQYAPQPAAPVPDTLMDEKKDEKRGNTPVGKDRTGAGPAEGAILDPSGAVTKQPVLREQQK